MELRREMDIEKMMQGGDVLARSQMERIWEHRQAQTCHIMFCGHFSAGKSTLINRLTKANHLPSSPIPTSANAVSLRKAARSAQARLVKTNEWVVLDPDSLNESCRDGATYHELAISQPDLEWPEHVVLWDTPGMDSTDDAHERITREFVPLADLVCYICDYQHVLAETNRLFLRKLQAMNKSFLFIVNQLDKHDEQELSLHAYSEQIDLALQQWGVRPLAKFMVSARKEDAPGNEWHTMIQSLLRWIGSAKQEETKRLLFQNNRSAIIDIHLEFTEQRHRNWQEEQIADGCERYGFETADSLFEAIRQQQQKWDQRQQQYLQHRKWITETSRQTFQSILRDVRWLPAETRMEFMHAMDSGRAGFRMGLFSTAKKIANERIARISTFADSWQKQLQIHVFGPIADWVQRFSKEASDIVPSWESKRASELFIMTIQEKIASFDVARIEPLFPNGMPFTDEYYLTCANELVEKLKQAIWQAFLLWMEQQQPVWNEQFEREQRVIDQLWSESEQLRVWDEQFQMKNREQAKWLAMWQAESDPFVMPQLIFKDWINEIHLLKQNQDPSLNITLPTKLAKTDDVQLDPNRVDANLKKKPSRIQLNGETNTSMQLLRTRFQTWCSEMNALLTNWNVDRERSNALQRRLQSLENRALTMAVFGAFSAGKSTLINALLGKTALPVSPHPTTAALISIQNWKQSAVRFDPDQAVVVHWKKEQDLMEQLRNCAHRIGLDREASAQQWFSAVQNISTDAIPASAEPLRLFLLAVSKGWASWSQKLGTQERLSLKELAQVAALESCSCFVEKVDVSIDSAWTNAGLVIVDTPGADSVFARHTELAYQMVKQADAIVYVCTYQHAFSQSDRKFLTQLAQTLQASGMNGPDGCVMYVILNAVDLANSADELQMVIEHVRKEFRQCGFDQVQLYPLSARQALRAGDEGFAAWEKQLSQDLLEKQSEQMQSLLLREMHRALHAFDLTMERQLMLESNQAQNKHIWLSNAQRIVSDLKQADSSNLHVPLRRETDELLYFMKQRLQYAWPDWFRQSFSPATFRPEVAVKQAFRLAIRELNDLVKRAWEEELLITQLRIEKWLKQHGMDWVTEQHVASLSVGALRPELSLPEKTFFEMQRFELDEIDFEMADESGISFWKSSKSFFEQGGRDRLMAYLWEMNERKWNINLELYQAKFRKEATHAWDQKANEIIVSWLEDIEQQQRWWDAPVRGSAERELSVIDAERLRARWTELASDCNFIAPILK